MAFNYAASAATALGLLRQFGRPVTILRKTGVTSDPVAGTVAGTPASVETTGARVKLAKDFFEGTHVQVGDQMWLLSAEQEPLMTDALQIDGHAWPIVAIAAVNPAGTPVLYKVLVGIR